MIFSSDAVVICWSIVHLCNLQPITNQESSPIMTAINIAEKLSTFSEHWSPRTVSEFNGHDVMVVRVKGEFVWHSHEETDDFFLVIKGSIRIEMKQGDVTLNAGEMYVVPKGVEHRPVADEEAHLLLIEPTGTPNTGSIESAAKHVRV